MKVSELREFLAKIENQDMEVTTGYSMGDFASEIERVGFIKTSNGLKVYLEVSKNSNSYYHNITGG